MTDWIVYSISLGILLSLGAEALARAARGRGHPERQVWVGALTAAVVLPALLPLLPRLTPAATGVVTLAGITAGSGGLPVDAAPATSPVPQLMAAAWLCLSALLAIRLLRSALAVRGIVGAGRLIRRAPVEIRLTTDAGPAVAGLLHPVVLLPRAWSRLPAAERRWVLRHELDHVRAGDPALVWLARIVQVAVPWNPAVWFLGRRLREGVEFDCDRRLLQRRPDPRGYGSTLLSLVTPSRTVALPVAAFREPRLSLERRFRAMTTPMRPVSGRTLSLLAAGVVLALVGACEFSPTYQIGETPDDGAPVADAAAVTDASPEPAAVPDASPEPVAVDAAFTPYTVAPSLQNREEVAAALEAAYPPALREEGIGGTAKVWLFIDTEGAVTDLRIDRPSGHVELDRAALHVAGALRFTPAMHGDTPTEVWVSVPITFQVR